MKKKEAEKKVEVTEIFQKAVEKKFEKKAPSSDMWALYNLLGERLEKEGIIVNGSVPPFVEMGANFVDNCMARINAQVGPTASPYNFVARVTCIVPKGQSTGLRLEILKNVVRAALKEPFRVRDYEISALVTNEGDERMIGVRKSELTINLSATKLKRR